MNLKRSAVAVCLSLVVIPFSMSASASLIKGDAVLSIVAFPDTLGGLVIYGPLVESEDPLSSIAYGSGSVDFQDGYGNPLDVQDPTDPDWWQAPGSVYTTSTHSIVVTFTNLHVTGFSFNVGASVDVSAWIKADYNDGDGGTGSVKTDWFGGIGPTSSPEYGVYISGGNSCASITRIEIEPSFVWGIGNLGIATGESCTSVPEPGSLSLLGAGLLALGLLQYSRRRQVLAPAKSLERIDC